jgi:hypothetical protein
VLGGDNVVCAINVRTGQQDIRLLFSVELWIEAVPATGCTE